MCTGGGSVRECGGGGWGGGGRGGGGGGVESGGVAFGGAEDIIQIKGT